MSLTASGLADLMAMTQRDLGKGNWTDIATDLQEYVAMPKLLKKEKVQFQSGTEIQFNLQYTTNGQARRTGLYAVDTPNQGNSMTTGKVPWRHLTADYSIDKRELAMNRTPARILELMKTRRNECMIDQAKIMEEDMWDKPADSTDTDKAFGFDYWMVRSATEGFNGGDPSGFTSGAADLPVATYTRWKNYTAQYAAVSKTDLVRKWRRAATFTMFKPPVDVPDYNRGNRYGYYSNYDVVGTLEELLEDQNDNLGNDLASKDGAVMFRRTNVTWVPYLESDTGDPIYGVNWGVIHPIFLTGEYMREDPPTKAPNQHNVVTVYMDNTYNYICRDRRRLFVIYK